MALLTNFFPDEIFTFSAYTYIVDSLVEWLGRRDCDRYSPGSKPTRAVLLCVWERHFTAHFPAWRSWLAVLD